MALIANDANDFVDQMILLTKRLCELTNAQILAFEQNDFNKTSPINDEASRLAATYALESNRIAKNPEILSNASEHLKSLLIDETQKFRKLMTKHEATISRGLAITEGLVKAIATEAANARPTPQAYSPNIVGINQPRRDSTAIALDQKA